MRKLLFCLAAFCASATGTAAHAQYQVSHPSIRYEEWHYSDFANLYLVGHFVEYCNGNSYFWGHPDAFNYYAEGDCAGY